MELTVTNPLQYFKNLKDIAIKSDKELHELRTCVERPALDIESEGAHQLMAARQLLEQAQLLNYQKGELMKEQNQQVSFSELFTAYDMAYQHIQDQIESLEQHLQRQGYSGINFKEDRKNTNMTLKPKKNFISESKTDTVFPVPKVLENYTPEKPKFHTTDLLRTPTLEDFGISRTTLAAIESSDHTRALNFSTDHRNPGKALAETYSMIPSHSVVKSTLNQSPLVTRLASQLAIPKFARSSSPREQETNDDIKDENDGGTMFPLIASVTENDMLILETYLRQQISYEFLNKAIGVINEYITDKRFDPEFDQKSADRITFEEVIDGVGLGTKTKATLLALMKLKRVAPSGRSSAGTSIYRIL